MQLLFYLPRRTRIALAFWLRRTTAPVRIGIREKQDFPSLKGEVVLLLFFSIIYDELLESFFCAGVIFGSIHARLIQIFRSQLNSFLLASCT